MSNGGQTPGPPGGYPAGGYASSQAVSRRSEGRLRAWARRRPEPRLWVTLAGAGCILAVSGLQLIAGDAQAPEDGGDGTNIPGIILSLLVVAAGFVLMHFFREQPASAAGVAAVVLGTPALLFFLTFDENSFELPFSAEAVLGGSALLWLIAYMVGPGSGRPLLLGGALLFGWLFVIQVTEDPLANGFGPPALFEDDPFVNDDPFADDGSSGGFSDEFPEDEFSDDEFTVDEEASFQSDEGADPTTIGIISVVFGGGFLVGARLLDRRKLYGVATPLVAVGHIALPAGILFLSDDLNATGTGLAFVLAGGLVIWSGALGARRATTIIGAIELIIGVVVVLGDVMEDADPTSVGSALFVIGTALVLGSQLLHRQTRETPPSTPGPSEFPGPPRAPQPAGAPFGPYAPPPGPYPGGPGGPPSGPHPPAGAPPPPPGTTAF
ncbi:MAG TPA: hypothetical protein VFB94_26165 [Acidimicrobiales bacterium]|nr:hypothetical protein [Acidimicrobiales bacterium]